MSAVDSLPTDSKTYTPGPWQVHWGRGTAYPLGVHNGKVNVVTAFGRRSTAEADANAKLIAAAPDMLEALAELSAMYVQTWDRVDGALVMMGSGVERFENAHAKVKAALEKARG